MDYYEEEQSIRQEAADERGGEVRRELEDREREQRIEEEQRAEDDRLAEAEDHGQILGY
ncbi:hypothetical protein [Amycolatopsis sp. NBC_01480]|uniref:hypothetical protein n=1 Tax=Amycolatopsis sp. NBC_01480 TaxID=2903562 RepID=UPI002E29B084|nr:hypothetical protein [Amycolatopsis sp. NBC_01480]